MEEPSVWTSERAVNVFARRADEAAAPLAGNLVNETRLAAAQVYASLALAAAVSDLARAIEGAR